MGRSGGEQLRRRLKEQALREGFDLVGVTTPDPLPHFDVYQRWLRTGHHGEMDYLASERGLEGRCDPRRIMPECRSIVVLASNYLTQAAARPGLAVAGYALGDDYHQVFIERLARLSNWIETEVGKAVGQRSYTDTGPLLERELAQRAGLGWIGKNTCLIHPQMGSYLLIAELMLDLELPADDAFAHDRCGSCVRCLDACPTACIRADRTLDARRCISYLTIELKGAIPRSLRASIGGWVFGCDVCQQVCPWNRRFARPTQVAAFKPTPFLKSADIQAFLNLGPEAFRSLLRGSALKRAKRGGLMRNAAVVAGNAKDPRLVPALDCILRSDEQAFVRSHAAWALGRIGGTQALKGLRAARHLEIDGEVLAEIELALEGDD